MEAYTSPQTKSTIVQNNIHIAQHHETFLLLCLAMAALKEGEAITDVLL